MEKISIYGECDNSEKRSIKEVKDGFTYFERNDVVIAKITPCFENGKVDVRGIKIGDIQLEDIELEELDEVAVDTDEILDSEEE